MTIARFLRIVGNPLFALFNEHTDLLARITARAGIGRRFSVQDFRAFLGPFQSGKARKILTTLFADVLQQDAYLKQLEHDLRTELSRLPVLLAFGENDPGRKAEFQTHFEAIFPHHRSVPSNSSLTALV